MFRVLAADDVEVFALFAADALFIWIEPMVSIALGEVGYAVGKRKGSSDG